MPPTPLGGSTTTAALPLNLSLTVSVRVQGGSRREPLAPPGRANLRPPQALPPSKAATLTFLFGRVSGSAIAQGAVCRVKRGSKGSAGSRGEIFSRGGCRSAGRSFDVGVRGSRGGPA